MLPPLIGPLNTSQAGANPYPLNLANGRQRAGSELGNTHIEGFPMLFPHTAQSRREANRSLIDRMPCCSLLSLSSTVMPHPLDPGGHNQ